MFLEGILSIAGQPGLLKLVSKKNNSVIVESLITGKRMPAYSTSRISTLEDITVYTYDNDTPLKDVFANIFNEYKGAITGVTAKSEKNKMKKNYSTYKKIHSISLINKIKNKIIIFCPFIYVIHRKLTTKN